MSPRPAPRNINLHPENHTPKTLTQTTFDVIVLGSGPVGRALATQTAASGLSSIIVEAELYGGDCPFWACVPSKALLRPAETLAATRQISGAKEIVAEHPTVDVQGVFSRRDTFTDRWDDQAILELSLSQKNCTVVRGRGELLGERSAVVKNVKRRRGYSHSESRCCAGYGLRSHYP
jgi:dihydrolipoamide dehydrogenase